MIETNELDLKHSLKVKWSVSDTNESLQGDITDTVNYCHVMSW